MINSCTRAPRPSQGLADPTRRAIFEHLVREGEQTVRALTDRPACRNRRCPSTWAAEGCRPGRDRPEGRAVFYQAEREAWLPWSSG